MDRICIEKSVGWFPSNDFAPRPRFYPPPRADAPSEGSRSPPLLAITCHMPIHATCYQLSLLFVWGSVWMILPYTPKTIPNKFFWTFLPQREVFSKVVKLTNLTPSLPGFSGSNGKHLPGIDRSCEAAEMAEIKPEVARGTEICATVDVSGCFFLDPRSLKLQF